MPANEERGTSPILSRRAKRLRGVLIYYCILGCGQIAVGISSSDWLLVFMGAGMLLGVVPGKLDAYRQERTASEGVEQARAMDASRLGCKWGCLAVAGAFSVAFALCAFFLDKLGLWVWAAVVLLLAAHEEWITVPRIRREIQERAESAPAQPNSPVEE